jgi:hypothetical protein
MEKPLAGVDLVNTSMVHVEEVLRKMAPRDPAEEMLVAQLLTAHARVMHLSDLACRQTGLEQIRTLHEYADRASNTYRRLMLALAEYRQPPRTGDSFTAIRQANFAAQQVVQNHEKPAQQNVANEQGCQPASKDPKALPADIPGPDIPAVLRPEGEAVGIRHRPEDRRRQVPVKNERATTR